MVFLWKFGPNPDRRVLRRVPAPESSLCHEGSVSFFALDLARCFQSNGSG
jgi:hypothetical protein